MTGVQFLPPIWQFTMICNPSPRGCDTLFLPLSGLHPHVTQTYMQIKHPYTSNLKIKIKWIFSGNVHNCNLSSFEAEAEAEAEWTYVWVYSELRKTLCQRRGGGGRDTPELPVSCPVIGSQEMGTYKPRRLHQSPTILTWDVPPLELWETMPKTPSMWSFVEASEPRLSLQLFSFPPSLSAVLFQSKNLDVLSNVT